MQAGGLVCRAGVSAEAESGEEEVEGGRQQLNRGTV